MISIVASIVAIVLPALLVAVVLYWIIRLGVKHGMRSYYAEKFPESETIRSFAGVEKCFPAHDPESSVRCSSGPGWNNLAFAHVG